MSFYKEIKNLFASFDKWQIDDKEINHKGFFNKWFRGKEPFSYNILLYGHHYLLWFFPRRGSVIRPHTHTFEHATLVLFGKVQVTGDAENRSKEILTAPDTVRFEAGSEHSIRCCSFLALCLHIYKDGEEVADAY